LDPGYNGESTERQAEAINNPLNVNTGKQIEFDTSAGVILLHGLGRFRQSMRRLEQHLKSLGYTIINLAYPSTTASIETIAEKHLTRAVDNCKAGGAKKIHFVGHSLGGIVVRQYLQQHAAPAGSRLVMLSPPNQGSEIVDLLLHIPFYRWLTGPAGQELGTGPEAAMYRLKPIDIEIGVIAGNRSMNLLFSPFIDGADDGRIAVDKTKLPEMRDFITVPSTHNSIVRDPLVIRQVAHFLKHGMFDHGGAAEKSDSSSF
jgi:pimeloyl-ACP methyl ester carboxylesterase